MYMYIHGMYEHVHVRVHVDLMYIHVRGMYEHVHVHVHVLNLDRKVMSNNVMCIYVCTCIYFRRELNRTD